MHSHLIIPPDSESDDSGAYRVFDEFLEMYQPSLLRVEYYLEELLEHTQDIYKDAYRPWYVAVRDLLKGVFLLSKRVATSNTQEFVEAIRMLSLDSAVTFIRDICISCLIMVRPEWERCFKQNLNTLFEAHRIIMQQQEQSRAMAR